MDCKRTELILAAQRKGFRVEQGETGWLVHVPSRFRHAENTQGDFKDSTRAWLAAASLAVDWPEPTA